MLALGVFVLGAVSSANATEIFNSDFSKGSFDTLGWTVTGDWSMKDYGADNSSLAKNPGTVAKFAANAKTDGNLVKKFDAQADPAKLTLTFDAGYGWGSKDHSQSLQVMLVDADGNGYLFQVSRAKASWGVQWGVVTKYAFGEHLNFAPSEVDTTQVSVHDGGGLRTFTITREAGGKFTFNGDGWTGGPLTFNDATTTSFSQVVLRGSQNTDDLVFGKVKLEVTK